MFFLISCVETTPLVPGDGDGDGPGKDAHEPVKVSVDNPKESLLSYLDLAESFDDYKIVYNTNMTGGMNVLNTGKMLIGYFKKGDMEKSVIEMSVSGINIAVSVFDIEDQYIICAKGASLVTGSRSDKYECKFDQDTQDSMTEYMNMYGNSITDSLEKFDDYEVEYAGESTILGRKCDEFNLKVDDYAKMMAPEDNESTSGDYSYSTASMYDQLLPQKVRINMCFDRETGVQMRVVVSSLSESELLESEYEEFSKIEAAAFETGIEDSVFQLPVKFSIYDYSVTEDELLVLITPFTSYDGLAEINFYNNSYSLYRSEDEEEDPIHTIGLGTVHLKPFEVVKILVKHGLSSDGYASYKYEVCFGDECVDSSFYLSSYMSSYTLAKFECLKHSTDQEACEAASGCKWVSPICQKDYGY
jgi:hypothetical protein